MSRGPLRATIFPDGNAASGVIAAAGSDADDAFARHLRSPSSSYHYGYFYCV